MPFKTALLLTSVALFICSISASPLGMESSDHFCAAMQQMREIEREREQLLLCYYQTLCLYYYIVYYKLIKCINITIVKTSVERILLKFDSVVLHLCHDLNSKIG